MKTRQRSVQGLGAAILVVACGMALAQDAGGPIRIIQGFAPGGGHDTVARLLAPRVGAHVKSQTIVEARPGANGIIAAEAVARSTPDGSVILLTGVSTFVLNQLVYAKVPYDTLKDFAPLTTVAATPQILVAHPGLPVKTLQDVTALAKRSPNKLSIGSPGVGGLSHLTLEVFKGLGKLEIEHVPYKGTASALTELLSGFVPMFIGDLPAPLPHVKSGKLRAIVVTGETRSSLLPDVPTAREQGYPGLQATNWYGVMVPAATPPAVVSRLHAAFVSAVGAPETRERYAGIGVDPLTSKTPAAFGSFVQEEFARWGKVVRSTGIRLQQ